MPLHEKIKNEKTEIKNNLKTLIKLHLK